MILLLGLTFVIASVIIMIIINKSPLKKKYDSSKEFLGKPLDESLEYQNVYIIDSAQSKATNRFTTHEDKSRHKRITSENVNI